MINKRTHTHTHTLFGTLSSIGLDPLLPLELPKFIMAQIQQGSGNIPQRFCSILTWTSHSCCRFVSFTSQSCSIGLSSLYSNGFPQSPDLNVMFNKSVWDDLSFVTCHIIQLQWILQYPLVLMWCLINAQLPRKYSPHHYTTSTSFNCWYKAGWILSCCLHQIFSLTSSYSYSSQNMSLKLLHWALIMRRVLTEPGKKKLCTQLDSRLTYNQSEQRSKATTLHFLVVNKRTYLF